MICEREKGHLNFLCWTRANTYTQNNDIHRHSGRIMCRNPIYNAQRVGHDNHSPSVYSWLQAFTWAGEVNSPQWTSCVRLSFMCWTDAVDYFWIAKRLPTNVFQFMTDMIILIMNMPLIWNRREHNIIGIWENEQKKRNKLVTFYAPTVCWKASFHYTGSTRGVRTGWPVPGCIDGVLGCLVARPGAAEGQVDDPRRVGVRRKSTNPWIGGLSALGIHRHWPPELAGACPCRLPRHFRWHSLRPPRLDLGALECQPRQAPLPEGIHPCSPKAQLWRSK